jgi:dipeptidyl aminopeptidase/acylaminoacyl peptidase
MERLRDGARALYHPALACVLASVLPSVARPAALEGDVWTPEHVAALKIVGSAAISPDGASVAYTLQVPRKPGEGEDGANWTELWVVDREQGEPRPYVTGKTDVAAVEWTPDGKGIAFLAKRGDDKFTSLYVIPAGGGEARRAASLENSISAYSFAPDGVRIALVAAEAESAARKKAQEKGFKAEVYEEDWQPSRLWIAQAFDAAPARKLPVEGSVRQVRWSPIDERIAISVTPTPLVDDEYVRQRVRIVDAKGGESLAKVENPGKLGEFEWSPDAKHLALISASDKNDPAAGRIVVADTERGSWRELLPDMSGDFSALAWRDADHVMFIGSRGVSSMFGYVSIEPQAAPIDLPFMSSNPSVEGETEAAAVGPLKILLQGGPVFAALSLSRDGQHAAFAAHTPERPAEVYTISHGDKRARRRTHHNPITRELRLARQEIFRWQARDGLGLEGILIHPLDEVAGTRAPLIVYVHGGPEAHESNGWQTSYSKPGQVAAARGFAVFHPNYRGSTGRGVSFSKLGQGDPGGKEFDDLVDGVDALVAKGLVDRAKVGVTGGSYGGYATAWCSTRYSERFAAGVMFVGIGDKVSKVGTTDIPDEEYYVHALKRPWEDWNFLLERSPIYYADKSKTPLLILHGKDDPRVNVGQSRELYRHLKLRGQAPVRLVLYPGEGHGNRKANSRYDYNLRMLQWMEHYLKGPGGAPPPFEISYEPAAPAAATAPAAVPAGGSR